MLVLVLGGVEVEGLGMVVVFYGRFLEVLEVPGSSVDCWSVGVRSWAGST